MMGMNPEEDPADQREATLNDAKTRAGLLDVIGGHGPWQFRLWVPFFAASLCNSSILFSVLFLPPQSFCLTGNATEASLQTVNGTHTYPEKKSNINSASERVNCTLPGCSPAANSSVISITNYYYHTECSNSEVEILGKCFFVAAFTLSAVFVYFSNKRFGRRNVGLASSLFLIASSFALCFADTAPVFLILRFLLSFTVANIYFNSALSLTRFVHKDFKLLYFLTGHLGWGLAHFLLPLVSWLTQNWMSFNLVLSSMCILLAILVWWSPDSPSSSYRLSRTRKALKYAAFKNGYSTTDVDFLPQGSSLRQEMYISDTTIALSYGQKVWSIICMSSVFLLTFTTSFLYFAAKWHLEWFKVQRGKLSFAFLGTTEVAAAVVLLFVTCVVATKHLLAALSAVTSIFMIVTYFREKPDVTSSSSKIMAILVFFASCGWTLVLVKAFCLKVASVYKKFCSMMFLTAIFCGALTASAVVLKARQEGLLLLFAIIHFTSGVITAFVPDGLFGVVE